MRPRRRNFFSKRKTDDFIIRGLTGELNDSDADIDIEDQQISAGQNIIPLSDTSLGKRDGISLFNNFLGTGGIDGGWSFTGANGTTEHLIVWNGSLWRDVSGIWTAVTGVTLQATHPCSAVYFANTDKFYITNGLDNVVKYTAGSTSGDQGSASIPHGKYITVFQGILMLANVPGSPNAVYYSDGGGLDTFAQNYFFLIPGEFNLPITAFLNYNNIMLMMFTSRRIFRLQNFNFDGSDTYAQQLYELPSDFGAIYQRTVAIVNNKIYFVGQTTDSEAGSVAVYVCDGFTSADISHQKIRTTMTSVNVAAAGNGAAVADSVYYRVWLPSGTSGTNNMGIVYDTSKNIFLTPETRQSPSGVQAPGVANPSMFWVKETSGEMEVYFGTQDFGQVFKMHSNQGLYDEMIGLLNWVGNNDTAVDANPAKRAAQSFTVVGYNSTILIPISKVVLQIKKNTGTTTDLVVRIETDNANEPSGTLAAAEATVTIPAITSTNYAVYTVSFTPFNLTPGTKYWIVVQHVTEGSGNSQYYLRTDTSGTSVWTNGTLSTYATGSWTTAALGNAAVFANFLQHVIDGRFTTKGYIPYDGRQFQMKRYETIFSSLSSYVTKILLGFVSSEFGTAFYYTLSLGNQSGAVFGTIANSGTGTIYGTEADGGSGQIYGSKIRSLYFGSIDNYSERIIKLVIGNDSPGQQFEFNQIMLVIAPRMRNF